MILYAVALGDLGIIVQMYFSDTYVLVLVLRRVPEHIADIVIMMDPVAKRRLSLKSSLFTTLKFETRHAAQSRLRALTGVDVTGNIQGKWKSTYFIRDTSQGIPTM